MPAIPYSRHQACLNTLKSLHENALASFEAPAMTHDDFEQLFIQPEHLVKIKEVMALCSISNRSGTHYTRWNLHEGSKAVGGDPLELMLQFPQQYRGMIPSYVREGPLPSALALREGLVDQINNYISMRIRIGSECALVAAVMEELYERCETPSQLRYFFAGFVTLLSEHEHLRDALERVREFKVPEKVPNLPRALRVGAQQATKALAKLAMLKPDLEGRDTPDFTVALQVSGIRTYLPWERSVEIW
jgi:hypothetical protein